MKVYTVTSVTHRIRLDESEQFDLTTQRKGIDPDVTVRVGTIVAKRNADGDEWEISAGGIRILKSGNLGKAVHVDKWAFGRGFTQSVQEAMWCSFPLAVRRMLTELGVEV
jgi:hypothetical protein